MAGLAERATATTGALSVRVLELETCSVQSSNVIDYSSTKVTTAHWINHNLYTVVIESKVTHALFFVEIEAVLVSGTSATNYRDTKEISRLAFLFKSLVNSVDR